MNAITLYRIGNYCRNKKVPFVPSLIKGLIFLLFNSIVPSSCQIGKYSKLGYGGIGVVIHHKAIIGRNVLIGPQVTIGGRSNKVGIPVIGDNVYIGTGAKVLGDILIGNNVIIGANAVVLKSVPDNTIVAGNPARVIRTNINVFEHCNLQKLNF